jgi:DNA-binding transcriptional ArsR family regulator
MTVGNVADARTNGAVDDSTNGQTAGELTNDQIFDVLSNRRRRYVIHYLSQHDDESVSLGDLSRQIAAWETGNDPDYIAYDERKTVHTSLYQNHVPKLAEAGIIEYDSREGTVRPTDAYEEVDLYLETVSGDDVPWSVYLLGLAVGMTLLAVAVWLDLPPFSAVSDALWSLFVSVSFLVSTAVFAYVNRSQMRFGSDGLPPEVSEE